MLVFHKKDGGGNQLSDRGIESKDSSETHKGIKNPKDLSNS